MPAAEKLAWLLDLGEAEAKVHRFLQRRGTTTAPAVARFLDAPRSVAYEVLRALVEKGLVAEEPGRPLQYHLRPLAEAMAGKRAELQARLQALEDVGQDIGEVALPSVSALEPGAVSMFHGGRAVSREAARLISVAQGWVTVFGLQCFGYGGRDAALVIEALRQQHENGADVSVYLAPGHAPPGLVADLEHAIGRGGLVLLQEHPSPMAGVVLVPGARLMTFSTSTDLETADLLGLRVRDGMADVARRALDVCFRSPAVRPDPGPGAADGLGQLTAWIQGATSTVHLLVGAGWSALYDAADYERLFRVLEEARRRGIQVRCLVDKDLREVFFVAGLLRGRGGPDVRVGRWVPTWVALVDGRHMLQAFGDDGDELLSVHESGSTAVALHQRLFHRLWRDASPLPVQVWGGEAVLPAGAPGPGEASAG